jgi:1,4-alpha-glucan branching enzyme
MAETMAAAPARAANTKLVFILNTHIPQVLRPPGTPLFHEQENWLFEAITETYVPLFRMLERLRPVPRGQRVILSFTPCVLEQLQAGRERFLEHLGLMRTIARAEVERTASPAAYNRPQKHALPLTEAELGRLRATAALYLERIEDALHYFERYPDPLTPLRDRDDLELWTSCPNHSFLPFHAPATAEYLVRRGIERFQAIWGRAPDGFWLPECGFKPGLEEVLLRCGIRRTALNLSAAGFYSEASLSGIYEHRGLEALVHDFRLAMSIWKVPKNTLPSKPVYREFYRDMGFDVVPAYLAALGVPEAVVRRPGGIWTGIKYHAITGQDVDLGGKVLYDPEAARRQAASDASAFFDFLEQRRPLTYDGETFVMAFDTEIFGHWWLEGVTWLEEVLRHHD